MSSAIPFIIAAGIFIAILIIARTDNVLGKIFRWFWNTSFKIVSHVPMCGWMAHFMIAKTPEERAMKDMYIGIGEKADENIPASSRSSRGFSQQYVGNGEVYSLQSTYNHSAVLRNDRTGQQITVYMGNESDGTVHDDNGNVYNAVD